MLSGNRNWLEYDSLALVAAVEAVVTPREGARVIHGSRAAMSKQRHPLSLAQEIGIRLAEIRRRGLTQRQLATAIGVTITAVQNWERGRADRSVLMLLPAGRKPTSPHE